MKPNRPKADQNGMAAVIALLVMVVLSILGLSFLGSSMTESQIGSNESDLKKALFAAEAGIQEAMYRMRLDPGTLTDESDTACTTTVDPVVIGKQGTPATTWPNPTDANFWYYNPLAACSAWSYLGSSMTGYGNYFGGTAANLDGGGRSFLVCASGDTSAYCTSASYAHKAGNAFASANLTNTASDPRSYTVTIAPVVGYVGGCWQYVDPFGAALGSCATVASNPIFKVTSTGTARNAQKRLSVMIRRMIVSPQLDGTLTANTNIKVQSASAIIDGHNYDCDGNNPSDTNSLEAATTPTGDSGININKSENLQCTAGTGVGPCGGTSSAFPDTIGALLLGSGATQEAIDKLNAYLESIKVLPADAPDKDGAAFHGIVYVDGNYERPPNGSSGILIVHHRDASNHDVAVLGNTNSNLTFKGLIIADKIDKINGGAQIIGGVFGFGNAADGVMVDDVSGTPTLKYSKCIIDGLSSNFPFQTVLGTWHEQ